MRDHSEFQILDVLDSSRRRVCRCVLWCVRSYPSPLSTRVPRRNPGHVGPVLLDSPPPKLQRARPYTNHSWTNEPAGASGNEPRCSPSPYKSIANVGVETEGWFRSLEIKLINKEDVSTYVSPQYVVSWKLANTWNCRILAGFQVDLNSLLDKLLSAMGGREETKIASVAGSTANQTTATNPTQSLEQPMLQRWLGQTYARHCPRCSSTSVKLVRPEPDNTILFNRECRSCRAVWRPGVPRWVPFVSMGLGTTLVALVVFLMNTVPVLRTSDSLNVHYFWMAGTMIELLAIGYSVLLFAGVLGQFGLLSGGQKARLRGSLESESRRVQQGSNSRN